MLPRTIPGRATPSVTGTRTIASRPVGTTRRVSSAARPTTQRATTFARRARALLALPLPPVALARHRIAASALPHQGAWRRCHAPLAPHKPVARHLDLFLEC